MDMRVLKPLTQGLMTTPAQVFLVFDQKLRVCPAMRIMAIGAYAFFERIMYKFLIQRASHFFMAGETERGNLLFHQSLHIPRMRIVTGCAFPFPEGEVHLLPEQFVLHFGMALEAEGGDILFNPALGV